MRDRYGSTGGGERISVTPTLAPLRGERRGQSLAVLGSGLSLRRFDFSTLDRYDAVISVNEGLRLYLCDYVVVHHIAEARWLKSSIGSGDATKRVAVVAEEVARLLLSSPLPDRRGVALDTEYARCRAVHRYRIGNRNDDRTLVSDAHGRLGAALSLALLLGAASVAVYGVDHCRVAEHGSVLGTEPKRTIAMRTANEGGRFVSESDERELLAFDRDHDHWRGMAVVNHSPWSELRCFPRGE